MAPKTMKRWVVASQSGIGGLELETDAPVPEIRSPTEPKNDADSPKIRINIAYLSLNARDLQIVNDEYPAPHAIPDRVVPVSDGCGVVEAVGSAVTLFKVGDRVAPVIFKGHDFEEDLNLAADTRGLKQGLGGAVDGVAAEYFVCDEQDALLVPSTFSLEEGSTLPVGYTTAWGSICSHHPRLQAGQTVLCLGTGGVSLCAAQIALVTGAKVILTSSSQAKLDRAKSLLQPLVKSGAPDVIQTIDYSKIDAWDVEARRLNGGRGVDAVIEIAGRGTIARSIRATKQGGLVAVSGYMSDYKPIPQHILDEDIAKTILYSAANVRGVFVCNKEEFRTCIKALEYGGVKPIIDKTFAFEDMKDAYTYLQEGRHFGKVCVKV